MGNRWGGIGHNLNGIPKIPQKRKELVVSGEVARHGLELGKSIRNSLVERRV